MIRIVLVRPGCTDFDQQGRMKGTLDIPLSNDGSKQVSALAERLREFAFDAIYHAPCASARESALMISQTRRVKPKLVEELRNIDHGLWHGKRIDEVKQTQPRVYRQGQEHGDSICPPGGEPIANGRERVQSWLTKLVKKTRQGIICCVVPEPIASVLASEIQHSEFEDLWEAELDDAQWQVFEVESHADSTFVSRKIVHSSHDMNELREPSRISIAK
jgi:broad specificity phosphatase PhoE